MNTQPLLVRSLVATVLTLAGLCLFSQQPAQAAVIRTITAPGTYSGLNLTSTDPNNPVVRISIPNGSGTSVTIINSTFRGPGRLIECVTDGVNLKVQSCYGYGTGSSNARSTNTTPFVYVYRANSVDVNHCYMERTGDGVVVDGSSLTRSVAIYFNKGYSIDGRWSAEAANQTAHFILINNVSNASVNVGGNMYSADESNFNSSQVSDIINVSNSQGTSGNHILIHNNFCADSNTSTGSGIIADYSTAYVEMYNNSIVHCEHQGMGIYGGVNNTIHDNNIICAGTVNVNDGVGLAEYNAYSGSPYSNNKAYNNLVGFISNAPGGRYRNDFYTPGDADPTHDTNTRFYDDGHLGYPNSGDEANEYNHWKSQLPSGSTVGP